MTADEVQALRDELVEVASRSELTVGRMRDAWEVAMRVFEGRESVSIVVLRAACALARDLGRMEGRHGVYETMVHASGAYKGLWSQGGKDDGG